MCSKDPELHSVHRSYVHYLQLVNVVAHDMHVFRVSFRWKVVGH